MCLALSLSFSLSLSLFLARENGVSRLRIEQNDKTIKNLRKKNMCLVSKKTCPDVILISTWHSLP